MEDELVEHCDQLSSDIPGAVLTSHNPLGVGWGTFASLVELPFPIRDVLGPLEPAVDSIPVGSAKIQMIKTGTLTSSEESRLELEDHLYIALAGMLHCKPTNVYQSGRD
jgi:hypothetical protein